MGISRTKTKGLDSAQSVSNRMRRVGRRDTPPEMQVRRALHGAGYRYTTHDARLPGTPDIVLPRYRTAVFVNGCFWHGHDCKRGRLPKKNQEYWSKKIARNCLRDRDCKLQLEATGWKVFVVWTCCLEPSVKDIIDYLNSLKT